MRPLTKTALLLLFCATPLMGLTACSATIPHTKVVAAKVVLPDDLRTCPKFPAKPDKDSQAAVARYINGVAYVGLDCKEKLRATVAIVDAFNEKAEEVTERTKTPR